MLSHVGLLLLLSVASIFIASSTCAETNSSSYIIYNLTVANTTSFQGMGFMSQHNDYCCVQIYTHFSLLVDHRMQQKCSSNSGLQLQYRRSRHIGVGS